MLHVGDHKELQAVVLAMKAADRDLKRDINQATRTTMNPVWKSLVQTNAARSLDGRVIVPGTRIAGGNPPAAVAASSRRKLRGGLVPAEWWFAVEFGGNHNKVETYSRRSPKGNRHRVTRHTARQLPRRDPNGRVAYPAFAEFGPRMASLWAQIVVKKYLDAAEAAGKG
ncbi:hypothetical protein [Cellulosimicrobium cellulans]|uniref:hypothetical protein n=1 Tax=Cellulosimicrobium cellulans TaxID=1710 RepID=UPI002406D299|nr:hypothetical protein [Cellulosimicrobium cellulans]MDF9877463.1 hypothetical protein [Cellulosimicrobium cellulans]